MTSTLLTPGASDILEAGEARVLAAAVRMAPDLGWGARLVEAAAREARLAPGEVGLLLPGGARDLAALLARKHDAVALKALAGRDPASMKVRERIAAGVEARIAAALTDEAAVRRATGFLALPQNLPLAARLMWAGADALWRWAGDTATDENHYTKRAILSEILVSTLAVRLARGPGPARTHLERRIEGVTAFERMKARAPSPLGLLQGAAETLGRRRYGATTTAPPAAHAPPESPVH